MENQTVITPAPESGSSGANTVLLVIIILLLAGAGYWWYTHRGNRAPATNNPSINVDVNLPDTTTNTSTTE